ncbi:MAG: SpoIIE family protein phosphatase [Erysipelotrichaceae bacterium]|nr:SpoIIE family protein phosphatase [Erysipelotrichaceae bacterium]
MVFKKIRNSMTYTIICAIFVLLFFFGMVVSMIGYVNFTNAFKKEYSTATYHMADTATALVKGDHLEDYLNDKETEEYELTKESLDIYCHKINVTMIYVIRVNQEDYKSFTSIFNPIFNEVDESNYNEWPLGYVRHTTNDEYREKYRRLYEKKSAYETVYRIKTTDGQHPHITTIVPVENSDDEVVGLLCMQRPFSELNRARRPYIRNIALSTLIFALSSALLAVYAIEKSIVSPVKKLSREMKRFAKENVKGTNILNISHYEELSSLASSIDRMETERINYVNHIREITAEQERNSSELLIAKTIQTGAIPNIFPAFPDRTEFDIYASMTPAKDVGGDFYNFFLIDDDHLAMVIGDVSGKGIPGALFMMSTNIIIKEKVKNGGTPADILFAVNNRICEHNDAEMFITIWLGILEISTGKIIAANAGHDDAVVYHDGEFDFFKTRHGIVVGAMEDIPYRNFEIQLEKGDKIFLYTDGVPEATACNNEMYGMQRLVRTLNQCKDSSPKEVLHNVHLSVDTFVGDAPQFDDLTMLCLELKA